ncbi:hypothetical protein [Undibacter mobilis]|uniref:hypothetical protein n=1 Tax=Undibacter mobilis TaxID=2292256 RepID=UPI00143DDE27|nr:hypothetical protein [Undibacter mobilis]
MDCTRILVRPGPREGWMIDGASREMGPYHCREMALRVAISEALTVRRGGRPARVALESSGVIVAKRCLCVDFGR